MSLLYPILRKSAAGEIVSPAAYVQSIARGVQLPGKAVLCPLPILTKYVLSQDNYIRQFVQGEVYVQAKKEFCFVPVSGCGAPAVAMQTEILIALGVNQFIFLGTAGSLQEEVLPGDVVVCQEALCADGTSKHYVKTETVRPNALLRKGLIQTLRANGKNFHVGRHWTTDAFFRETKAEIAHYQKQSVLSVDMEASAFLAVCRKRGVQGAAAFVVSDVLNTHAWKPDFTNPMIKRQLRGLFDVVRKTLAHTF